MINIEESFSLKSFNTFGLKATTRFFAEANNLADLRTVVSVFKDNPLPKLILGGGSNLLFTNDFEGITIYPDVKGFETIKQTDEHIWVRAYAGENWDSFVEYCVSQNWGGVENLSHIPGNIGACPIQNIGAYGVEVKDVIEKVEALDLTTAEPRVFTNEDCKFGYRDSIFKNEAKGQYLVVAVIFKLAKKPEINTNYKDVLEELKGFNETSIATIRKAIINIRKRKLPDPEEFGNAGSFFKNSVIAIQHFEKIKTSYPEVPFYPISETEVKIPAAWLIQTSGWKGVREGNTGTHPTQPLVIINYGNATGSEIYAFATKIQQSILKTFAIELEMEVRVI